MTDIERDWARLQALFERLLATPGEQRHALAEIVEPDAAVRRGALALLAAHESPRDPLDACVLGALRQVAPRHSARH